MFEEYAKKKKRKSDWDYFDRYCDCDRCHDVNGDGDFTCNYLKIKFEKFS